MNEGAEFAHRAATCRESFLAALQRGRLVQAEVLQAIVDRQAGTEFGRFHGLASVRNIDDFRQAVPLRTYEEMSPWLQRVYAGEPGILTSEPPVHFVLSSGTTADAKRLPLTGSRLSRELYACWLIRMSTPLAMYPGLAEQTDSVVNLVLSPRRMPRGWSPGGVPEVVFSELPWLTDESPLRGMPGTAAPWFPPPPALETFDQRAYYTLRLAVEHAVKAFFAMNPLVLLTYARCLRELAPRIIEDVHNGTMNGAAAGLSPNPARARALAALAGGPGGLRPRDVWAGLELISCWNPISGAAFVREAQELFGATSFLPGPYASSEAVIALPLDSRPAAPLAILNAFFEFLPEESEGTDTVLAHQLEVGRTYEVVVTQSSGLYRYRLGDLVRVADFIGMVPTIEVVGRKATFSFDLEKLTDYQVLEAGNRGLAQCGLAAAPFCCVPIPDQPPRYVFVYELAGATLPDQLTQLGQCLDRQLRTLNFLYDLCRQRNSLAMASAEIVPAGTFRWVRELRVAAGASALQTKERILDPTGAAWLPKIRQSYGPPL